MLLYGVPLSPFVRKTLLALYELPLEFEKRYVFPASDDLSFREISPRGQIPAFVDNSVTLVDSSAICHYLLKHEQSTLIDFSCASSIALNIKWDKFADIDLHSALFDIVLERVIKPCRFNLMPNEEAVEFAIREKIPAVFSYLETELQACGHKWLLGENFSYADIAVGAHLSNLTISKLELSLNKWPAVEAYVANLADRPAYQKMCQDTFEFTLSKLTPQG